MLNAKGWKPMPKIDTAGIAGYAEMTVEQKLAALEGFEFNDNSAELERLKNATSKANSEAAEWKRKHNALLSEEEQKKNADAEAFKKVQEELEELRKEKTISEYTAQYIALGYDRELAEDTAKAMQSGDMKKVFANGEKHKQALEKSLKEQLLNEMHQPGGTGGSDDSGSGETEAVKLAKQIASSRYGNSKSYADVISKYK